MTELEKNNNDIKQLCFAHKVKRLYAFGSVLTNRYTAKSDIDFIVDFQPMEINQYADNYYDFKFSLENILHRPIDLLEEKAIKNPYFLQVVNNQRQLVYGH
jgi:predicted nucleotidyltransferase